MACNTCSGAVPDTLRIRWRNVDQCAGPPAGCSDISADRWAALAASGDLLLPYTASGEPSCTWAMSTPAVAERGTVQRSERGTLCRCQRGLLNKKCLTVFGWVQLTAIFGSYFWLAALSFEGDAKYILQWTSDAMGAKPDCTDSSTWIARGGANANGACPAECGENGEVEIGLPGDAWSW